MANIILVKGHVNSHAVIQDQLLQWASIGRRDKEEYLTPVVRK